MADIVEVLADKLQNVYGGLRAIPSQAPGGGPEAEREGKRTLTTNSSGHQGRIGTSIPKGQSALGYGGYGDPVVVERDIDADVQRAWRRHLQIEANKALRVAHKPGDVRFNQPFNPEINIADHDEDVLGAWSLFDGTILLANVPANGQFNTAVNFAAGTISPVFERLYRYPGAISINLRISSFSFVPTATTATGLIECWFSDIGGATCPLGVYPASSQTAGVYIGLDKLLTTPYTDPGVQQVGTLVINSIGVGTPVNIRWQLGISYEALLPDPKFNEQMVVSPTPAEIAVAVGAMGD